MAEEKKTEQQATATVATFMGASENVQFNSTTRVLF